MGNIDPTGTSPHLSPIAERVHAGQRHAIAPGISRRRDASLRIMARYLMPPRFRTSIGSARLAQEAEGVAVLIENKLIGFGPACLRNRILRMAAHADKRWLPWHLERYAAEGGRAGSWL